MVSEINSISRCVSGLPCRKYSSSGALADIKWAINWWVGNSSARSFLCFRNPMIHESAVLHYSCRAQEISRLSTLCLICCSVNLYVASKSFMEARSRRVWEGLPIDRCRIFFTRTSWTAMMCSSRVIESLDTRLVSASEFDSFAERRRLEARR